MSFSLVRRLKIFTLTPLLLWVLPTHAEVTSVNTTGFALAFEQTVSASADDSYRAMLEIGDWWDANHSWEGKAENLYIDARVGGCFCEKLSNGGFAEHMHLAYLAPGKEVRLTGGLGPLQGMGMGGAMVWSISPGDEGQKINWTYTVHGHGTEESMKGLAPIVNSVQQQAFDRLIRFIETGNPETPE